MIDLAKIAYDAYRESRGWKSYRLEDLPQWDKCHADIRASWEVAVNAVLRSINRSDLIREATP